MAPLKTYENSSDRYAESFSLGVKLVTMDKELHVYKNYAFFVRSYLIVSGLWPNTHPIIKKFCALSTFLSTFIAFIIVSNYCLHNLNDVMKLTRGMGLALSFLATFLKVNIFLNHHNDIVYLNEVLSEKFNQDLKNSEDLPHLVQHFHTFARVVYPNAGLLFTTMVMQGVSPLLKKSQSEHVFPSKYPFDYEPRGLAHWFFYYMEFISGLSFACVNTGVDCGFVLYALQMCNELKILGNRFIQMSSNQRNYSKKLRDCIRRHYLLMQSKHRMEDVYGFISIWMAISSALVICSIMFQVTEMTKTGTNFVPILQLVFYILPKLLQIFVYGWYGNLITVESKNCLESIYNSQWPDSCNTRFKNDILIILTQEPIVLLAKGCMYIQLDMFTKIVKASVSWFCILRQLNEANY